METDNRKQMTLLSGLGSLLLMFLGGLMLMLTRIGIDSNGYLVISPTFAIGLTFFGFAILLAIFGRRAQRDLWAEYVAATMVLRLADTGQA